MSQSTLVALALIAVAALMLSLGGATTMTRAADPTVPSLDRQVRILRSVRAILRMKVADAPARPDSEQAERFVDATRAGEAAPTVPAERDATAPVTMR